MEDRLIDLETRLTYQEAALHELNTVVTEQQRRVEQLERLCRELATRIARAAEGAQKGSAVDEVPPHY